MKKTWCVLPGYCVGLGGLLLITYRTLLAVSSPGKAIMVSVNQFGEQYLDLVCLVFLWIVCLVGLWSLSSLVSEKKRKDGFQADRVNDGAEMVPALSFGISDSFHQRSALAVMGDTHEGSSSPYKTSFSVDDASCSVSVSVVVQQEGFQG